MQNLAIAAVSSPAWSSRTSRRPCRCRSVSSATTGSTVVVGLNGLRLLREAAWVRTGAGKGQVVTTGSRPR
ncbi:cation transporter P-type ATPase D [Streptomyces sp. NPDC001450]